MTNESHFRTYRAGPATRRMYPVWLFGGLLFGTGLLVQLFLLVEHGDGSPWMVFNLAVVASVVFGYASAKRSATITTPDHIEIRTLFGGTRQIAWADIEEIGTKGSTRTSQVVVIRINGRRIGLPHVSSRDIASFSEEVRLLRGLWERRRGPESGIAAEPSARTRLSPKVFAGLGVLLAAITTAVATLIFSLDNSIGRIGRYDRPRGDILVGSTPITGAEDTGEDQRYKRTYSNGPLYAAVTGYASQAYGTSMLEEIEDKHLTAADSRDEKGGDVVTTLNDAAQKAAFEGLGSRKGAVVAINPATGAILALVSTPSYDPSDFTGESEKDATAWKALQKENTPDVPLLNRALRETYPPGSTFEVVTAAAALENGLYDGIDEETDSPLPWTLPDTVTTLANESDAGCENGSLRVAFGNSCNTVFGKISADLGNEKMIEQAEKFGFNAEQFVPVHAATSVYPEEPRPQNALAGIGQASNRATPLQMAMVAAAVANDGKLMKPYMVSELQAPNQDTVEKAEPEVLGQATSAANARKLQQMMEYVVTDGTGQGAAIDDATVGGKAGTAQNGVSNSVKPYAWFISYAEADNGDSVAVAVVVEDGVRNREDISGGGLAAPIAKAVMGAALKE